MLSDLPLAVQRRGGSDYFGQDGRIPALGVLQTFQNEHGRGRYYADEILWSTTWMERTGMGIVDPGDMQECYDRVMAVVVPWLPGRLAENRRLRQFVATYPDAVPWSASWLDNIDFFFMDVWDALELDGICQREPYYWQLEEKQHFQIWLQLKTQ